MDELKSLNLTLGFYFFKNLKNLNLDFLGFLGFLKNLKNLGFFKAMSNSPASRTSGRPVSGALLKTMPNPNPT